MVSISRTGTSYIITGLAPGTLYDIDVVAVNRVGSSLPVELSQRTAATAPVAPVGLTVAEVTFNSITVSWWDAPVADGGAPITGHQISWRGGDTSGMASISITTTSYTITGLAPGTLYDIDVVAINRVGSSLPVELSQRTVETAPVAPAELTTQSISVGSGHSCAISNGAAKCWGDNGHGQLGNGTQTGRRTPVQVTGLETSVTAIAAGYYHSCAIQDGVANCWGWNYYGQLGDGTITSRSIPVQINGLSANVTAIAPGWSHTCAIQNGAAKCWGYNRNGQLGDGTTISHSIPVQVSGLTTNVTAIAAGEIHTCAIQNGAAKCWGYGDDGVLGDGTDWSRNAPVKVNGLSANVTAITAGTYHTCAIQNGAAKCWGYNNKGQLGDGTWTEQHTPVQVTGLETGATAIAVGLRHTCAIQNGAAKCWGANYYGVLGDGTGLSDWTDWTLKAPVQVHDLTADVTAISVGLVHSCAIQHGIIKCWGWNKHGRLGDGSTRVSRSTPVPVVGLGTVPDALVGLTAQSISVGEAHSCAIFSGAAKCWGNNSGGELRATGFLGL